jgi:transcriptional pleiotropic repressor
MIHMNEQQIMAAGWERAKRLLSYTETQALASVLPLLNGAAEGNVIGSAVADKNGFTRSVLVNALQKVECAGLVETRSLGMKGTRIKILWAPLAAETQKLAA